MEKSKCVQSKAMTFKEKTFKNLENQVCKEYDYLMKVVTVLILQHWGPSCHLHPQLPEFTWRWD